jgi:hypothetical protein
VKTSDGMGGELLTKAISGPSQLDKTKEGRLELRGYTGHAIQVDTFGAKQVNFYNSTGVTNSMSYDAFKKIGGL